MLCPKRVLALGGCVLFAATCTQDTTTAPAASPDVGVEAMPDDYGSEGGTITLTRDRTNPGYCAVKVALNNLFVSTDQYNYVLHVSYSPEYNQSNDWFMVVLDTDISPRGTYRSTASALVSEGELEAGEYFYFGWYTDNGTRMGGYPIGYFYPEGGKYNFSYTQVVQTFKVANRCF